eukprot:535345_1
MFYWLWYILALIHTASASINIKTHDNKHKHDNKPYYQIPNADKNLHIYGLPIGQGDYTVIQCPISGEDGGEIYIFDGGSMEGAKQGISWNREKVMQFLLPQIVNKKIQGIIISHPDLDHYNYIESISTFNGSKKDVPLFYGWKYPDWKKQITPPNTYGTIILGGDLKSYTNHFIKNVYNTFPKDSSDGTNNAINLAEQCVLENFNYACGDTGSVAACPGFTSLVPGYHPCGAAKDTITFEYLAANIGSNWPISSDSNSGSIILKVTYGEQSIILPGDFERECAWTLLQWSIGNDPLKTTVFKVPHHGSKYSFPPWNNSIMETEYAFISGYSPKKYGHPSCSTIKTLTEWYTADDTLRKKTQKNYLTCFKRPENYCPNDCEPKPKYTPEQRSYTKYPFSQLVDGIRKSCKIVETVFTMDNKPVINERTVDCKLESEGCEFAGPFTGMELNAERLPLQATKLENGKNGDKKDPIYDQQNSALNACKGKYKDKCGGVTQRGKEWRLYQLRKRSPRLKLPEILDFYKNPIRSWWRTKDYVKAKKRRMLSDDTEEECIICDTLNSTTCPIASNLNKLTSVSITPSNGAIINPTTVCLFPFTINNTVYSDFIEWSDRMNMRWMIVYYDETYNNITRSVGKIRLFGNSIICNDTSCVMKSITLTDIGSTSDDNVAAIQVSSADSNSTSGDNAIYSVEFGESGSSCNCYETRKDQVPDSSIISTKSDILNILTCQRLCYNHTKCKYFQYTPKLDVCSLLYNDTLRRQPLTDTIIFGKDSCAPTASPTIAPSSAPTASPTDNPTNHPTPKPTPRPTETPEEEDEPELPDEPFEPAFEGVVDFFEVDEGSELLAATIIVAGTISIVTTALPINSYPTSRPTQRPSFSPIYGDQTRHPTNHPTPKPTPRPTETPEEEDEPELPDEPFEPAFEGVVDFFEVDEGSELLAATIIVAGTISIVTTALPINSYPTSRPTQRPSFSPIYGDQTRHPTNSPTKPPTVYHNDATICFENNTAYDQLNGEYVYYTWNYSANAPVYYDENNEYYLFPYEYEIQNNTYGGFYIYNLSMCVIGYKYEGESFSPDQCNYWFNYVDNNYTLDTQFNGHYCTEEGSIPPANLCLKNNTIYKDINGGYEYIAWNYTSNGGIYYNNYNMYLNFSYIYLFPWTFNAETRGYWVGYSPQTSTTLCTINISIAQSYDYIVDISQCVWYNLIFDIDTQQWVWVEDLHMFSESKKSCVTTLAPTSEPTNEPTNEPTSEPTNE